MVDEEPTSEGPSLVSASEHALLSVARALLSRAGGEHDVLFRRPKSKAAARIGPTAARLLGETLRKGIVLELVRRGGWRTEACAHDGRVLRGRTYQRHPDLKLRFTPTSFALLAWLRDVSVAKPDRPLVAEPRSLGDELLLYLALDRMLPTDLALAEEPFGRSALCWLGHTAKLARHTTPPPDLSFDPLVVGGEGDFAHASIALECLQEDLSTKWTEAERGKSAIVELERMRALGEAQSLVLGRLLDALDRARRRDLAGFLVDAAVPLLRPELGRHLAGGPPPEPTSDVFVAELDLSATLEARQHAYRAAAAFLRAIERIGGWSREHGSTRHFDEEYDVAQMLLSRWDRLGAIGFERATRLAHDLESLHSLGMTGPR